MGLNEGTRIKRALKIRRMFHKNSLITKSLLTILKKLSYVLYAYVPKLNKNSNNFFLIILNFLRKSSYILDISVFADTGESVLMCLNSNV